MAAAKSKQRKNDPEGMRQRLLDVAAEAFQSAGYHATSTHEIMRAAGVTGGAMHHHFPTKKSLGLAVIRERVSQAVERTWIEPVKSAATGLKGAIEVFDRTASALEQRGRVLGCPITNLVVELALADAEFQGALQLVFQQWRAALAARLQRDQAEGLLDGVDPDALATLIVASFSGAMTLAKAQQNAAPLEVCAQQLSALVRK
jgi:AcrR family transcriptional regulator